MSIGYFTVKVSTPRHATEQITTIASGPMAAVSAITRFMADKRTANEMKRATFACRSGWFYGDDRIDPGRGPNALSVEGAL